MAQSETILTWDSKPTTNLPNLISEQLTNRSNACQNCYCHMDVQNRRGADRRTIENKRVTEVILSSLRTKNAEDLISLMQNYVTEEQTIFNAPVLHALVIFLIEPTHPESQKLRVKSVLEDHFLLHPSCGVYMCPIYRSCMFDDFKHIETSTHGNKILEYVLNVMRYVTIDSEGDSRGQNDDENDYVDFKRFQQHSEVAMSEGRVSHRKRRPTSVFGFETESEVRNIDHRRIYDQYDKNDPSMRESTEHYLRDLFWVLHFFILVMEHDLIAILNRKENIEESLIHKTSFASKDKVGLAPKDSFVDNLIEITKYCSRQNNLRDCTHVCFRFFELLANTSALAASTQNAQLNLIEMSAPCRFFADYLRLQLFNHCEKNPDLIVLLGHVRPEWLRYRIVEPLVQKTTKKLFSRISNLVASDIFYVSKYENCNGDDYATKDASAEPQKNTEELNNSISEINAKKILSMIFIDSAAKLHGGNRTALLADQNIVSEIEMARRVLSFKYSRKS